MNYKIIFINIVLLVALVFFLRTMGFLEGFKGESSANKALKRAASILRKRNVKLPKRGSVEADGDSDGDSDGSQ